MKIAFMGSHGVGKTTLCYDLAGILKKHMPRVDIVKEVARACPLPINKDTTLAAQSWILHTQIASEITAQAQNDAVICDRCMLDIVRDRRSLESQDPSTACALCGRSSLDSRAVYVHHGVAACADCVDNSLGLMEREEVDRYLANW